MDNQIKRFAILLTACFSLLLPKAAQAQMGSRGTTGAGSSGEELTIGSDETELVRKQPGFFRRPVKKTAAEQLAYASGFEKRGWEKAAQKAYRNLVHQWHDSPEAVAAQIGYSEMLQARGKYAKAFNEYQYLFDFYAGRFPHSEILEKQLAIANEIASQGSGKKAIPLYEKLVKNAPKWEYAPKCQILAASILESEKDYEEAILAYEGLLVHYSTSEEMPSAIYGYARTLTKLADRYPRNERYSWSALAALEDFVVRYPSHPQSTEAATKMKDLKERLAEMYYERAFFYDRREKPKAAIIAYTEFLRNFGSSERADEVSARLAELKAKETPDANTDS